MKKIVLFITFLITLLAKAQVPTSGDLVTIHSATLTEINTIASPYEGSLVYNSDDKTLYQYDGVAWKKLNADEEETRALAAEALKEDTANKSTDVTLADGTNTKFPTELAVKTYVDNLPRVYVGTFRITVAGTVTITGVPFQPSSITFTAYANVENYDIDTDNGVGNNNTGIANAYGNMRGFARDDSGTTNEQVIYNGGHGNSINDISRYASSSHSIGLRYSNQNGDKIGLTTATVTSFNSNGFTMNTDNFSDGIVVIFEAYR